MTNSNQRNEIRVDTIFYHRQKIALLQIGKTRLVQGKFGSAEWAKPKIDFIMVADENGFGLGVLEQRIPAELRHKVVVVFGHSAPPTEKQKLTYAKFGPLHFTHVMGIHDTLMKIIHPPVHSKTEVFA